MKIAEIFYSIQGEGILVGVPSVFIRTSGCNLRCTWCDTPYTSWQPEGEALPIAEVIRRAAAFGAAHTVVTGGEPMIAPEIVELTRALETLGQQITIETAGTVHAAVACHLMSISPKLSNSTPWQRDAGRWAQQHERLRYQPGIVRRLMDEYPYQLKFVVTDPADLAEIRQICQDLNADRTRVLLMPEGTHAETIRERGRWLAECCKNEGFRYSPRLHVDLWGDRRGV